MYALLVTFYATDPIDELEAPFTEYAYTLRGMPGLLSKAWIRDGNNLGGFHLLADRASAEDYPTSDLASGLRATDGFDDFKVRGFEVLGELSALTGVTDLAPLAAPCQRSKHDPHEEHCSWSD